MACSEDQQQSNFKHFCRVCRKGFMCGRALGGHMRAHGIGDESGNIDEEEDPASDWEDKVEGSEQNSNKRMYSLRTNPNRLKSCRVCENCGKEFLSWKSFLEHGKCSSEDGKESLVSYPYSENDDDGGRKGFGWSKRKRSFRVNVGNFNSVYPTSEDDDISLAKCLMSLSNARVDSSDMKPEESHTSTSRDEERRNITSLFLPPLSRIPFSLDKAKGVAKGMFECKACKKVFNSHQALGGHRASHKKVKGCFATQGEPFEDNLADDDVINYTHEEFFPSKSNSSFQYHHSPSVPLVGAARRKSKVHECSICHRVFSSGQALGGHKRCHWLTSNSPDTSSLVDKYHHQFHDRKSYQRPHPPQHSKSDPLDLNFPAPAKDIAGIRRDPPKPLSFEVSTEINLQSWVDLDIEDRHEQYKIDDEDAKNNDNKNNIDSMQNVDDEGDSKLKLAKLSEFKDINISGTSSPWLQVGIGSTTDNGANKP